MNGHMKTRVAMVLVFSLAISLLNNSSYAASKPKISTKKVTFFELGKTKTIKITGVKKTNIKKLTVKSSNKKAVTSVTSGKTSFLVIASGYGKSTVKVKLSLKKAINKKKSFSWSLPVSVVKPDIVDPTQEPVNTPTTAPSASPIGTPSATPTVSPTPTSTITPTPTIKPTPTVDTTPLETQIAIDKSYLYAGIIKVTNNSSIDVNITFDYWCRDSAGASVTNGRMQLNGMHSGDSLYKAVANKSIGECDRIVDFEYKFLGVNKAIDYSYVYDISSSIDTSSDSSDHTTYVTFTNNSAKQPNWYVPLVLYWKDGRIVDYAYPSGNLRTLEPSLPVRVSFLRFDYTAEFDRVEVSTEVY